MKTLRIALAWSVLGGWAATAGTLEIKPLGKPVRLHDARTAAAVPSPQSAPFERIWDLREGPTIDVATGQIIDSGRLRSNTVIYDNTTNSTGYYAPYPASTQIGDALFMTNGGTLQRMKLSIFNGDATNKLLTAKIKVVFYDGATPTPNLIASFTTPTIHFDLILPGGLAQGQGVLLTLDASGVNPPIVLPQLVYVGQILKEITGTPAAPTSVGPAIYSPPTIGASRDNFWTYTFDGTGVFEKDENFGGDPIHANFYYELEVDPVALTPPPIYDNTTNPLGGGVPTTPEDVSSDDLYPIAYPPGEFLDRLDFSVYNGDSATTLNSTDLHIMLRAWNPASSEYYGESDPTHSVTLAFTNVPVNLPPGYAGFFYVDHMTPLGVTVPPALLAGIRFRNTSPPTITAIGQALYYPPTVGTTDGIISTSDWPPYVITGAFYWRMSTAAPSPCTQPGDMNCDGLVNSQDIDGFVLGLFNPAGYAAAYPNCSVVCGDFTGDGFVNSQDIDSFIAALFR